MKAYQKSKAFLIPYIIEVTKHTIGIIPNITIIALPVSFINQGIT